MVEEKQEGGRILPPFPPSKIGLKNCLILIKLPMLISGGLVRQKTGIIFKVKEFKTTPSILQHFKCQGFRHKAPNSTKNQKCVSVVQLIRTKIVQIKKKEIQNVQIVGDLMLPIIKAVLHTRTKLLGST